MTAPSAAPSSASTQVLGEQQAEHAPRSGSERQPDADLPVPRAGARQHQVRGVAADGEQQQEQHSLQDAERADEELLRAARRLPEPQDPGLDRLVRFGVVVRELSHRDVELGLRRGARRARRQPPGHAVAALAAILELARSGQQFRRHRRRHPEIECQHRHGALEPFGRDADDRQLAIVDPQRPAEHARRFVETRLPVRI